MTDIEPSTPIAVPADVAKCPICGATVYVQVDEWETESRKPVGITLDCETEPDIDGDEWWDWHREHFRMPYVDWLPLEAPVLEWLQRTHRVAD